MQQERKPMTRASHPEASMHLPEGMTCSDCRHFARCNAIFGHVAGDEVCDWAPSRFAVKASASTPTSETTRS